MKKIFKPVVYGLTGMMLIGSLTACGKKQDDTAEQTENTAEESETETADETEAEPEADMETEAAEAVELNAEWPESLALGDVFTDFTVTTVDGQEFTLSEALKDHKAVLINVWATYCGPCKKEFPELNNVYKEYSEDVAFICLSCYTGDTTEDIVNYRDELGLEMPMGFCPDGMCQSLGLTGIPTTIIVDRYGHCGYEKVGAFKSERAIKAILDAFISDDYTEPQILEDQPVEPNVEAMADDELSAAVCADGTLQFTTPEGEYSWPFVKADQGVINSNVLIDDSECSMETVVEAKAGDIFGFDYSIDSKEFTNCLAVSINDNYVRMINGKEEGTYAYEFKEDGTYDIVLDYMEKGFVEDTADTVNVWNATLATGDAAETLKDKIKTFPQTLEGSDMNVELLNARAITFEGGDDVQAFNEYGYKFYVADSDELEVHVCLGEEADAYNATLTNREDGTTFLMAKTDTDETGFNLTTSIGSGVEKGKYSYTLLSACADCWQGGAELIFVFPNEENANYFAKNEITDDNGEPVSDATWKYEDGTAPSTDKVAEEKTEETASADGTATYTIHIVDENGDPVDGCIVNVCTDVSCQPSVAEGGELTFTREPYTYVIHVIKYPDGYVFDTSKDFTMPEEGGELTITVPHSGS